MERVSFPYVSPVTQSCCLQDEKENCFAKEVCAPQDAKGDDRKQILPLLEEGALSVAIKVPLLNELIRAKIRQKLLDSFGGNVELFIIGGAPINKETEAFLKSIHFPIIVGYGMTECAPLISVTVDPSEFKIRSCGKYLKGMLEVKIDSGETTAWL